MDSPTAQRSDVISLDAVYSCMLPFIGRILYAFYALGRVRASMVCVFLLASVAFLTSDPV